MSREDFIEIIRKQYSEKINEAYLKCEHEAGSMDFRQLRKELTALMKNSRIEGLTQKEFHDLVDSTLPDDVRKVLNFTKTDVAA